MAQSRIENYFNVKKRSATDEVNLNPAKRQLLLDADGNLHKNVVRNLIETTIESGTSDHCKPQIVSLPLRTKITSNKMGKTPVNKLGNIEEFLTHMGKNKLEGSAIKVPEPVTPPKQTASSIEIDFKNEENESTKEVAVPEPVTPTKHTVGIIETDAPKKLNAMDRIKLNGSEPTLSDLKLKFSRSGRLAELKASLARFKQAEKKLEQAEKRTQQLKESPTLKNFKALELEVNVSPQKVKSPEKPYLSPKKEVKARKNLFSAPSPTKNSLPMTTTFSKQSVTPVKESLTLPYKYRCLAEIFRAIDTISQIMYNRKETITFKKLKPAVEAMLKRNLTEKHLSQIKYLYPGAFTYHREKLREFGSGTRQEHWELVITPNLEHQSITAEFLLERRRILFKILIDKLKVYHKEFLKTLNPPIEINHDNIARWHPEFDIEKVPDIDVSALPEAPNEEKLTTGSQVLEKARAMFHCNTRMERALENLKKAEDVMPVQSITETESLLKGIPKVLLEKVRQRQAAKALETMTRSVDKEKEVQLYERLPEIARLARNLFVAEKKSVLPLELVLDKLCNSYRVFCNHKEMEKYLKTIEKEVKGWLTFCEIRKCVYIKVAKTVDLSLIINKLKNLLDQKKAL